MYIGFGLCYAGFDMVLNGLNTGLVRHIMLLKAVLLVQVDMECWLVKVMPT